MRVGLALALAGLALAAASALAASSATIVVKTGKAGGLGSVLVSATGRTLYHDTSEGKGAIKCTGACATEWLPLTIGASARPGGGTGVSAAKLGTIKRPDGKLQVTYNGLALYRYAEDAKSGEANGQGEGKRWYAVTLAGKVTKAAPAAETAPVAPKVKSCPIVGATVGGAFASGTSGTLNVGCNFAAGGLQLQLPGHTVASVVTSRAEDTCSVSGDTVTCTLDTAQQQEGIAIAGAWANIIRWRFTPTDSTSTSGACGFPGTVTLTNAGVTAYSKTITLACSA